jgi:phospholipid N-methyltransferase
MSQSLYTGLERLGTLRDYVRTEDEIMDEERARFERLKGNDVKPVAVSSFNLFPTPPEIAARLVKAADLDAGQRLLEPSAGTGRLLDAIPSLLMLSEIVAVEISQQLAGILKDKADAVHCRDFLTCTPEELGLFDRVVMNPPFKQGRDIKHIKHAATFLRPGGRLVALCANGPRQRDQLQPIASTWEVLPEGSFRSEATGVSVAMMTIDK